MNSFIICFYRVLYFTRLKSWMMEASEPCRSELSQVLFPLFVHLYLELVAATGRQAANKFFKKHYQVCLFKGQEG